MKPQGMWGGKSGMLLKRGTGNGEWGIENGKLIFSFTLTFYGNQSFHLKVILPTSRFTYIEVDSPTRSKSFCPHDLSHFTYITILLYNTTLQY